IDLNQSDWKERLHDKYFPNLPLESDKLKWMEPVTEEEDAQYSPMLRFIAPSELRFDFQGRLITPKASVMIDSSEGLHHHSDAPGAAGYTLAELSHLSRSTVPSQRCIAISSIGKVLYRAKHNRFGDEISKSIRDLVEPTGVIGNLLDASDEKKTKHLATRTMAVEALWLW
ncbi:hypothetical protein CANCADRAFT_14934, partial [Tortispora caseinolytica NRRL Y-17796]